MVATFKLSLDELDSNLLEKMKDMFPENAVIEIKISKLPDETDYLFSTSANRESLMKSLAQLENSEIIVKEQKELGI